MVWYWYFTGGGHTLMAFPRGFVVARSHHIALSRLAIVT